MTTSYDGTMQVARLFRFNEIATLASGLVLVASYLWMKLKVPDYRFAHLNSPGPLLGLVEAYRQSPRPEAEKTWVSGVFRAALAVFLFCAVISFAAGFVAAVRGPAKLIEF
jgi:hypothetical protein